MNFKIKHSWAFSLDYLIFIIAYLLLFYLLYKSAFTVMFSWWGGDDYSYCYLIPFIVIYLLWEKRTVLFQLPSKTGWKGIIPLIMGIGFYWLGELGGEYYTMYLSSWFILMGLCLLHLGWVKVKTILFPLCLILTMFPLPNFFNNRITLALKLISTKIGVIIMRAWGMSAYQDGNIIDLGFTQLQVVDACSGLRYLFPLIVLGILMAYFFRSSWWKKVIVVLSTIPITIFTNSLRIALTGILSERFGSKAVEGFFHDFEGWLIFMVAFTFLAAEMFLLAKLFPEKESINREEKSKALTSDALPITSINSNITTVSPTLLKQPQFIVSVALLTLTLILSNGIEFREAVPISKKFDTFPMQIGKWQGMRQPMEEEFINALDFSDYIMVDYHDEKGAVINFYVAYYESQRKGESIHSPETCLRGGGWVFSQNGRASVPLDGQKGDMVVNRALIQKGSFRQISYFWFPMRGRILTNAFEMKWYNFLDALTQQRTDGALVRVIAPVGADETPADAEKRLQEFVKDIVPVLAEYLPE
ncbi:MAG: VPLPA-CTERM-specific exosortase XrtD [Desulfamplus sp.]